MKQNAATIFAALCGISCVLIWSEARSTAINANRELLAAKKKIAEPIAAQFLDQQFKSSDRSLSSITVFAIAGVVFSTAAVTLFWLQKKPNHAPEPAPGSVAPRAK